MDLSKAVDCLSHKIFMEKLHAYCFDLTALKLVYSYLPNINKIQNAFSIQFMDEILPGGKEGYIPGPLCELHNE